MSAVPPRSGATAAAGPDDRIVLFDGVCRLCHGWVRFLIRHDRREVFKLCSVQSAAGRALLAAHGLPVDRFDSMVLGEGGNAHLRSAAFFRVMRGLGLPWTLTLVFLIIPRPVRDWLYDRIARHRYRIFGQLDVCVLPEPEHERRFIGSAD